MGITKLLPFLKDKNLLRPFEGWPQASRIAIDVPIFAHKFIYKERSFDGLQRRFLHFANDLSKTCTPIFVFDGEKLSLKDEERERRHEARDKQLERDTVKRAKMFESMNMEIHDPRVENDTVMVSSDEPVQEASAQASNAFPGILFPTRNEYIKLKTMLSENGFTVMTAKYEAEALCAYLTLQDEAWATLTEDTDSIAFGSKRTIFKYFSKEPVLVEFDTIIQALGLSKEQFIDLCCLFGCDFCDNVYKIGPVNAYNLIKRFQRWDHAYEKGRFGWGLETRTSAETFHARYPKVFECFQTCAYESTK